MVNWRNSVIRFGVCHLMATNLALWSISVATEAAEEFAVVMENTENGGTADDSATKSQVDISSETGSYKANSSSSIDCLLGDPILVKIGPYLIPFIIEYVLIAASILYRIYSNIGKTGHGHVVPIKIKTKVGPVCHKATSGLFCGWAVLCVILLFVVTCLMIQEDAYAMSGTRHLTTNIYLWANISVNLLGVIVVVVAIKNVGKLSLKSERSNNLDQTLVLLALSGYLFLLASMLFAAAPNSDHDFSILHVVSALVTFIQVIIQTMFLMDASQRYSTNIDHQMAKYGRSDIILLLLINAAMWLINTFQLKELTFSPIMKRFYGNLTWAIIAQMFIPLAIFYRFHCVVFLADVWSQAYRYTDDMARMARKV